LKLAKETVYLRIRNLLREATVRKRRLKLAVVGDDGEVYLFKMGGLIDVTENARNILKFSTENGEELKLPRDLMEKVENGLKLGATKVYKKAYNLASIENSPIFL